MREKLFDTLFISSRFEHHIRLEALHFHIHVRSRQKHFDVVDGDGVVGADIDNDTRVQFLLQNDLSSPQRWLEHESRLVNFYLLGVEVRRDFNCVARLCIIDSLSESLEGVRQFASRSVLVHDDVIRTLTCT